MGDGPRNICGDLWGRQDAVSDDRKGKMKRHLPSSCGDLDRLSRWILFTAPGQLWITSHQGNDFFQTL
jgi:hypothetical protein